MIPHKIELLAPAGNMESMRAAVENGADAVYFGLKKHNARKRADNFSENDLDEIIAYCHSKDVNTYMVFNTLIYNEEMPEAINIFKDVVKKGIDGVIIQDIGVGKIFKEISPDIPLHASTQMTVTSVESARFAKNLGYSRVILARELNLDEITRICKNVDVEVETFVHGALCMAYSGQCLTSSFWGGRSANRGECAQACRMPYTLSDYRQENVLNDIKKQYLLSPGDFNLINELEKMIEAGVRTFKIEGRLKSPEYVATVTASYRKALDHILYGAEKHTLADENAMAQVFSRGYIPFYFDGQKNHTHVVQGEFPKTRGLEIGKVIFSSERKSRIKLIAPLTIGDGIVMAIGTKEAGGIELGGNLNKMWLKNIEARFADIGDEVDVPFGPIAKDARVWKTNDPKLNKKARESFENPKLQKKIAVTLILEGKIGEKLVLTISDKFGSKHTLSSETLISEAHSQAMTYEKLFDQLSRMGNTIFKLGQLTNHLADNIIFPISELNQLRRTLLDEFYTIRIEDRKNNYTVVNALIKNPELRPQTKHAPVLKVVVRTIEQVTSVCQTAADVIVFDFNDLKFFKEAAEICNTYKKEYHIATPRIQKPKEEGFFKVIEKLKPKGVLVRNLGSLEYFKHSKNFVITGDYSLNIVNNFSKAQFEQYGMQRLTPSFEIDTEQLANLVKEYGENIEMAVHYQVPAFHSEYCHWVGNLVESGKAKPGCGELCQTRAISVTDRKGIEHPIQSDAFCRNTVFHGIPVSYLEHITSMLKQGINSFRIELVYDDDITIKYLVETYKNVINGQENGQQAYKILNSKFKFGIERGKMN